MTKRFLIALAIVLLAAPGFAQLGGTPGFSGVIANPSFTGIIDATGGVFKGATPLCFEGATVNAFETCFAITDPAAVDKTITFPNLSGTVLLGGAANSFAAATTSITFTGAVNATPLLSLQDDDTAQNFLTFTDVGTAGNVIAFQQDVNGPGWQVATTDGVTTNTLVQNENNFQVDLAGPVNADVSFVLTDDDTAATFLTFTDVGTPANIITLAHDVNTPNLSFTVASGGGTGVFTLTNAAGVFGGAAANDTFSIQPAAAGGAAVAFTQTTSDITGAAKTVTWADASGVPMLTSVANNAAGNAGSVTGTTNGLIFEGTTGADGFELTLSLAQDPGADYTVSLRNGSGTVALDGQFNHAIADSGGAGAATYNYEPLPGHSVATFDCLDADGCNLNVGETNAYPGQRLIIIQTAATSGTVTVLNNAGVVNLDAAGNQALTVDGTIELVYFASTWQQISLFYDGT